MSALQRLANVIRAMPTKRYLDYIRSPQWQRIRIEYLDSVEWWCQICGKAKACQVHHWVYWRLGHELPGDLCAVCVTCHHRLHCIVPDAANDNQLELPFSKSA